MTEALPREKLDDGSLSPRDEKSDEYRRGLLDAAQAAGLAAWTHVGSDAYSQGMDAGARHQVKECVEAIRRLIDATGGEARGEANSSSPSKEKEEDPFEREPLKSLLEKARNHVMTDEEIAAQRESWTRQDKD